MQKKYSLYIPCYNASKTLKKCLSSVMLQKYPFDEVIVVDDGSTDNTAEIAKTYDVTLIEHTQNKGLAEARNTGVSAAKNEFVASIDADVVLEKDWLLQIDKYFSADRFAGVSGRLEETQEDVFSLWRKHNMTQHWGDTARFVPFMYGAVSVFNKKVLLEAGLYNPKYKSNYEDYDICRRLKESGHKFFYIPYAKASHLKEDNLASLLDSFWNWQFYYYSEKDTYQSIDNLEFKLKENIGLANRLLRKSFAEKDNNNLYIDFLLSIVLSLKDIFYFKEDCFEKERISDDWLFALDAVLNLKGVIPKRKISLVDAKFNKNMFLSRMLIALAVVISRELNVSLKLIAEFVQDVYYAVAKQYLSPAALSMIKNFSSSCINMENALRDNDKYLNY